MRPFWTVLVVMTACSAAALAQAPPESPQVRAVLQPFVDSHDLAGIDAVVATKDGIAFRNTLGYADLAAGRKMGTDDFFWIASMTKPITGAALMILVDEGKVALDDPVEKYVPEMAELWVVAEKPKKGDTSMKLVRPDKKITVRNVLSHTAGFAFLSEIQIKAGLDAVPLDIASLPSVTGPLVFQPESDYLYSNQGINVAGRIIEVASGVPFAEFLQKRLFDPLEMKETTFWPSEEQLARLAKSYRRNKEGNGMDEIPVGYFKRPFADWMHRYAEPGGGLFSTTADVVRFCQMIAGGGTWNGKRILSPEAVKTLGTDQTGALKRQYGLGWETGGERMGHGGAHGTRMYVYRDGTVGVFMIQGAGDAIWKAGDAFMNTARESLKSKDGSNAVRAAEPDKPFRSEIVILDVFSGETTVAKGFDIHVEAPEWSRDGNHLYFNSGGKIYKMPSGGGEHIRVDTGSVTSCNNDHVISPDGKTLAISAGGGSQGSRIYVLPIEGGEPKLVTERGPSYLHGWAPDGLRLVYTAQRDGDFDIYSISPDGGEETRLTTEPGLDDGPEYSRDGKYVWFNSVRSGLMQIWRIDASGGYPVRMSSEEANCWFPHPSPDGKWIVYLAYEKGDVDPSAHPANKNVRLCLMPSEGGEAKTLLRLFGGQGTINVNSWSPDGKRIAFVRYAVP